MLQRAGLSAGAVLVAGPNAGGAEQEKEGEPGIEVTPAEDLMREHGVLDRLLLIYEKGISSGPRSSEPPRQELAAAAQLIRTFIEDYHERLEEDYVFPRFEKAGKLTDLVAVLRRQHNAGRRLTDVTLQEAGQRGTTRERLAVSIGPFIRMYRPHAARETTVLFPQLHTVVTPDEYDQMGEMFEDIEHQKFGPAGFDGIVAKVADIEKTLGLYDLAQFTPKST
jgi:hemerythrin-like domain-containing protein